MCKALGKRFVDNYAALKREERKCAVAMAMAAAASSEKEGGSDKKQAGGELKKDERLGSASLRAFYGAHM